MGRHTKYVIILPPGLSHNSRFARKNMPNPSPHAGVGWVGDIPPAHVGKDGAWFHADLYGFQVQTGQRRRYDMLKKQGKYARPIRKETN